MEVLYGNSGQYMTSVNIPRESDIFTYISGSTLRWSAYNSETDCTHALLIVEYTKTTD